jgi:hypothetical protein
VSAAQPFDCTGAWDMGRFDDDYKLDGREKCERPFSGGRALDFQIPQDDQ